MSDVIKLLPDSVANQIAAGEVIQRPASVVKELVENAVDAGAKNIQIIIKDAGRTLVQVIDDGCGMSETDARMAFERHATSKIRQATDLYTLHTMGFRGEALPSIAAVSQIDLRTMGRGNTVGTRLLINGSKVESQEPEACLPGTNLMVKNLFFNIPVRRKFLKKDSVELANVLREFERLALVNTDIEFTIIHNDVTLHRLLPATFKKRIVDLFGKNLERQLIPVQADTSIVKIDGYIGLPDSARRRGALQFLMVNGRNMRHPYFHKAIMQCYAPLISPDSQPSYFLRFTVDPESIDVNIHPTKNEIKFENEQPIWQILNASVRESLSRYNAVPAIDFDRTDAPDIPLFNPDSEAPHDLQPDLSFNPFEPVPAPRREERGERVTVPSRPLHERSQVTDWQKLYDDFNARIDETIPEPSSSLQIKNRFIVAPCREGMMVVDQHRAHLRVLYDSYLPVLSSEGYPSQHLMLAEPVELTPVQAVTLKSLMPALAKAGFIVERSDDDDMWSVTALPAPLADVNPSALLVDILEHAADVGNYDGVDGAAHLIALSMARSGAVKANEPLPTASRERLLASLLSLPAPRLDPLGRPVYMIFSVDSLNEALS